MRAAASRLTGFARGTELGPRLVLPDGTEANPEMLGPVLRAYLARNPRLEFENEDEARRARIREFHREDRLALLHSGHRAQRTAAIVDSDGVVDGSVNPINTIRTKGPAL